MQRSQRLLTGKSLCLRAVSNKTLQNHNTECARAALGIFDNEKETPVVRLFRNSRLLESYFKLFALSVCVRWELLHGNC